MKTRARSIVSILMSPHFCYRLDSAAQSDGPRGPLDDYALASRLSYFLWASMPDRPLLDLAAAANCTVGSFGKRRPSGCWRLRRRAVSPSNSPATAGTSGGSKNTTASIAAGSRVENDLREAMF